MEVNHSKKSKKKSSLTGCSKLPYKAEKYLSKLDDWELAYTIMEMIITNKNFMSHPKAYEYLKECKKIIDIKNNLDLNHGVDIEGIYEGNFNVTLPSLDECKAFCADEDKVAEFKREIEEGLRK